MREVQPDELSPKEALEKLYKLKMKTQMFVMRITWQVGEVWSVVVSEQELAACALQMVAVPQRFKRTIFNDDCFVDFQQSTIFKA